MLLCNCNRKYLDKAAANFLLQYVSFLGLPSNDSFFTSPAALSLYQNHMRAVRAAAADVDALRHLCRSLCHLVHEACTKTCT